MSEMAQVAMLFSSFGEDEQGNMYVVDMRGGTIYRITAEHRMIINWLPVPLD